MKTVNTLKSVFISTAGRPGEIFSVIVVLIPVSAVRTHAAMATMSDLDVSSLNVHA
jgi:hypothetical protein